MNYCRWYSPLIFTSAIFPWQDGSLLWYLTISPSPLSLFDNWNFPRRKRTQIGVHGLPHISVRLSLFLSPSLFLFITLSISPLSLFLYLTLCLFITLSISPPLTLSLSFSLFYISFLVLTFFKKKGHPEICIFKILFGLSKHKNVRRWQWRDMFLALRPYAGQRIFFLLVVDWLG